MKLKLKTVAAIAAILLLFLLLGVSPRQVFAAPAPSGESLAAYDYTLERYSVDMTVYRERKVEVREVFTASFSGSSSHGVIRDLPLERGVRYLHLEAECDNDDFSPYVQTETSDNGSEFLSVYLRGDGLVRGQERTYTLRYTMYLPAAVEEGYLSLDILGFGMSSRIGSFQAMVTLPDGLEEHRVLSAGNVEEDVSGNTISVTASSLAAGQGITLDLRFAPGVLSVAFDMAPIYMLLVGVALLLIALCAKGVLFREPLITATVNFEAPESMDPLLMGKLIDGAVGNEDLGAAIFYFADKGYLKLDMEKEEDPQLILQAPLPADAPEHLKIIFEGLFRNRERVAASELNCAFYRTAQTAKRAVDASAGALHKRASKPFVILLGVLSVLACGGFAFLYSLLSVFGNYMYWVTAVIAAISFVIPAAMSYSAKQRELKWKRGKVVLFMAGGFLLGLLPAAIALLSPNAAFGIWVNVIAAVSSSLVGTVSGTFLTRTKEHSARLGQILGFKQFILYTERDKIDFMLREDPELYYHVLPYAQVLGITDAWTEKFKGLTMEPPAYCYGYRGDLFDVIVFSYMYRTMNVRLVHSMVSRPSSSGSGGHSGSFGGGFGGGGFGGGGMRGC